MMLVIRFWSSGVFTLIAVSWYAGRVIHEFYDQLYGGVRCVCVCMRARACVCGCVH